jgi:FkbM family methyltransferase
VSVDDGLDTDSAEWNKTARLFAVMATWEEAPPVRRFASWDLSAIEGHGFSPRTVIDVGAAAGTPELYQLFPHAHHVLIEPLEEFADQLEEIARAVDGEYIGMAIGAKPGVASMNIEAILVTSSLKKPIGGPSPIELRQVPINSLDQLLEERQWQPPFGLKIDTEGSEREVIEGGLRVLEEAQFVIAEVSVTKRFESSSTSGDFIALMTSRGFGVVDVIDARPSPLGSYADVLFRPSPPHGTGTLDAHTG